MLLNDEEIQARIESPLNLLNRLRDTLNHASKTQHPSLPPKAEDVISDLESKINTTKSKARDIMNLAMDELKTKIYEAKTPETLARIAREMSTVVNNQDSNNSERELAGTIVVYAPQVVNLENYNIVDVQE